MKDHHMSLAHQRRYVAALSMYLLLLVGAVFGQTPGTGAVSGVVYDPSNHVVVNAEVLAVNDATHLSRSVMTTTEGIFRVPLLPPGTYSVTVNAPGFAANISRSIPVTVSEITSLNVTLAIAGVAQSAQVKGNASVADLESSTLGGVVDETAIQSLPLVNPQLHADPGAGAGRGGGPAERNRTGKRDAECGLQRRHANREQYSVQWHRCEQPG